MIRRRLARICLLAAATALTSHVRAGVWGSQPVIGISGDYSTNPGLLNVPDTAEEHGALLLDAPTSYVGDGSKFTILPSFRFSNAAGYSSLDSDYDHLNVTEELDSDRNVFTATGGMARDSSLLHDYILNGSTGVERNSILADLNWDRKLTERLDIDGDLNAMRVHYAAGTGTETLTDYRYWSFAPSLSWNTSERGKLSLSANVGRYNSLDGLTQSTSANLQLGFAKQLSEVWSLSASGGYSRADNQEDTYTVIQLTPTLDLLIPVQLKSTQTGSVYSVNIARQASLLYVSATASRQLAPTGFAYLSSQDAYELKVGYPASARWSLSGDLRRVTYQNPEFGGVNSSLTVTSLTLGATWQWTEHWTVSVGATSILEHYGSPSLKVDSSGVNVEVARHFDWKQIQAPR
jgi:hypothetical protein